MPDESSTPSACTKDPTFDVQHRDCFDSLAAMRDAGGVDLILTSPPYPDARTPEAYGAEFDTSLAGYHALGLAVYEALKPGGVCALNIDGPVRKWRKTNKRGEEVGSERSLIAWRVAIDWADEIGFRFVESYAREGQAPPASRGPRWTYNFSPVPTFARPGSESHFDRWAYTRKAKRPGRTTGGGHSRAEGDRLVFRAEHHQAERRCLRAVEFWPTRPNSFEHPAPFPSDFADAFVLCYSPPGGLVGDPFAGSGTVPFSCHRHGRRFIGGDLGTRQTHKGKPCGRRWADIVNDGLRQTRLFPMGDS